MISDNGRNPRCVFADETPGFFVDMVAFYLREPTGPGNSAFRLLTFNEDGDPEWEELEEGPTTRDETLPVTFRFPRAHLQELVDVLAKMGYRPRDEEPDDKWVASMQDHLYDMREVAFKALDALKEDPRRSRPPGWGARAAEPKQQT